MECYEVGFRQCLYVADSSNIHRTVEPCAVTSELPVSEPQAPPLAARPQCIRMRHVAVTTLAEPVSPDCPFILSRGRTHAE